MAGGPGKHGNGVFVGRGGGSREHGRPRSVSGQHRSGGETLGRHQDRRGGAPETKEPGARVRIDGDSEVAPVRQG